MPVQKPFTWAIAAGVLAAVLAVVVYPHWIKPDMSDFGVCYQAGQRALRVETLYRVSDGHLQYKYAPVSSWLYAGFALLPLEAAKAVWFGLEILLLAACFGLAWRVLPSPERSPALVLGLGFLVTAKFIGRELELGQVNILILALLLVSIRALQARRDGLAGVSWAASLFFKPYALVLLPYFVLKGRWRLLGTGLAVLAGGLLVPTIAYGWSGNLAILKEWAGTLSQSTPGLLAVGDNASLRAFLWKLLGGTHPELARAIFLSALILLAVFAVWLIWRGRRQAPHPEALETAFLFVLVPLLSPLGWYYNYLYALPAVILLLNAWRRFPAGWKWVLGLDLLLLGATLREVLGAVAFHFYTHHSLVAVNAIVLLAALLKARRDCLA